MIKDQKQNKIFLSNKIFQNAFLTSIKKITSNEISAFTILYSKLFSFLLVENFLEMKNEKSFELKNIFSNEQILFDKKISFRTTKKLVKNLIGLSLNYKTKNNFIFLNIFSKIDFDIFKQKITVKFTPDFLKLVFDSKNFGFNVIFSPFLTSNFFNSNFKLLFLKIASFQTNNLKFQPKTIFLSLDELFLIFNLKSSFYKQNFKYFNRDLLKPIFKKIKKLERFKKLEITQKFKISKNKKNVLGFDFKIFPFFDSKNLIDEQKIKDIFN